MGQKWVEEKISVIKEPLEKKYVELPPTQKLAKDFNTIIYGDQVRKPIDRRSYDEKLQ